MRQWLVWFFLAVATGSAEQSQMFFVPAGGTTPLGLIQFTGIQVQVGETLQFSATGLANGCPGHSGCIFRDANGAPAGSQEFSGPESGGNFQIVTDGVANIYSLVGAISNSNNDAHFQNSQWFAIGTSRQIVADRSGELVLALENAVYNGATGISGGEGGFTVTVTIPTTSCTYKVAPTTFSFSPSGGTGDIVVTVSSIGCGWQASIDADWIKPAPVAIPQICTVTGCAAAPFFAFSVAPNPNAEQRVGKITIAGTTVTVTQAGSSTCMYAIKPASQISSLNGGNGQVSVFAPGGCPWSAVSNAPWITVTPPGSSGSGNGSVFFTVGPNSGGPRSGTITIAGQTFTVSQMASACGATDVSEKVSVMQTPLLLFSVISSLWTRHITLTNTTGQAIPGPVYLVLDGLPKVDNFTCKNGCGIVPAQPVTRCQSPSALGSYLIQWSASGLAPFQSIGSGLTYVGSSSITLTQYTTRVLSGTPGQ